MKKHTTTWLTILIAVIGLGAFFYMRNNQGAGHSEQSIFGGSNKTLTEFQKKVVTHFREGDMPALSVYFEDEVALRVLEDIDDFYLKNEAENVLTEFCQNHTPKQFFVKHHGSSNGGKYYLIGELRTTHNEKYRVFVSNSNEKIETIEITTPPENF